MSTANEKLAQYCQVIKALVGPEAYTKIVRCECVGASGDNQVCPCLTSLTVEKNGELFFPERKVLVWKTWRAKPDANQA